MKNKLFIFFLVSTIITSCGKDIKNNTTNNYTTNTGSESSSSTNYNIDSNGVFISSCSVSGVNQPSGINNPIYCENIAQKKEYTGQLMTWEIPTTSVHTTTDDHLKIRMKIIEQPTRGSILPNKKVCGNPVSYKKLQFDLYVNDILAGSYNGAINSSTSVIDLKNYLKISAEGQKIEIKNVKHDAASSTYAEGASWGSGEGWITLPLGTCWALEMQISTNYTQDFQ